MPKTPSTMLPLGTPAPSFKLPDPGGRVHSLDEFKSAPALVVMFICNHCPFVKHIRAELAKFGKDCQGKGAACVAINSNNAQEYPDDSPAKMAEESRSAGYTFPYLVDESQEAARAYKAACTPDFYLFDKNRKLVYRGQFDDSRPDNGKPVTGKDLRTAVEAVLAGKPAASDQKPSIGCNIKWKAGKEPEYFKHQ